MYLRIDVSLYDFIGSESDSLFNSLCIASVVSNVMAGPPPRASVARPLPMPQTTDGCAKFLSALLREASQAVLQPSLSGSPTIQLEIVHEAAMQPLHQGFN